MQCSLDIVFDSQTSAIDIGSLKTILLDMNSVLR